MSRGDGDHSMRRAFGAASFEEEKHLILGRAHLALAAKSRQEQLRQTEGREDEYEKACQDFGDRHWEFIQALRTNVSEEALNDRETMLWALRTAGQFFEQCSLEIRADAEVALAAFSNYPPALLRADEAIRKNREVILQAVRMNRWGLRYASPDLQDDKEVALAAVGSHPWALDDVSEALKCDKEVVLTALRKQTSQGVSHTFVDNVLAFADENLWGDEDLVLEAIRVDRDALLFASSKLRRDKNFLLKAIRTSPVGPPNCLLEADEALRKDISSEDLVGAAESVLAVAGEIAPVITVTLLSDLGLSTETGRPSINSCEATLLSGATFTCKLPSTSTSTATPTSSPRTWAADSAQLPALKRQKFMPAAVPAAASATARTTTTTTTPASVREASSPRNEEKEAEPSGPALNVAELAKAVLEELPRHAEMQPPPERIFLVFSKCSDSSASIPVTPWDWNEPLETFV